MAGTVVITWELDLKLAMQSVVMTIKVVSSNPTDGEVASIQRNVIIKFVSEM